MIREDKMCEVRMWGSDKLDYYYIVEDKISENKISEEKISDL
jgi:hypothetical protein